MDNWKILIERAAREHRLTEAECTALLAEPACEETLAAAADKVRQEYVGDGVHLRALIEFSNFCRRSCCYCGLRREHRALPRRRMTQQEILQIARQASAAGYETVVLQSGEDAYFTAERLASLVREIKQLGVAVTLSVGERPYEDYALWREAGADRYLLRLETADEALYSRFNPGMSWSERVRCLKDLRSLGYEVGTGSLIGLPGQTPESLARDLLFYQALDADMLGLGPLIPNPATPLGEAAPGDLSLTRRLVALARLLLPEANIPATTAVATSREDGRKLFLSSGANVIMPSFTAGSLRQDYALYPGKARVDGRAADARATLALSLRAMGRTIARGQGSRRRRS